MIQEERILVEQEKQELLREGVIKLSLQSQTQCVSFTSPTLKKNAGHHLI